MLNNVARVLIASSDSELSMRFTGILDPSCSVTCVAGWPEAVGRIASATHHVVIIEPALARCDVVDAVAEISSASGETHIIVIENPPLPDTDQVELFKLGVHGFCQRDISPELLVKAVESVVNGELWMQRSLITRIIDELTQSGPSSKKGNSLSNGSPIECLTPRELEVARMVHKGGNNKSIARTLDISERTVKAHLSSIFRKLNIENRLHLAIFFHDVV
jgi:two-component system, NarL family, nitrate/nitrite response regulator NarL